MSQIIFKKINEVDPNNSEAVKDVLTTFFQHLSKHAETNNSKWLSALENIITRYPKYCGSHRNTIELYISKFVDSTDFLHVISAAKCAHAIQQVRPPQEKTATAKNCWKEHLIVLCNIAHKLITELFPNAVDMYKDRANSQKPQFQTTDTSPLYSTFTQINSVKSQNNTENKQHLLSTKLKNVFIFLQALLVEIYPVAKPVQPQLILEVIVRSLSVSSGTKSNLDESTVALIKIETLRTLDALVACLGVNLIPFSALIFKFIIQTLRWTTDNPSDESRKVRCASYDSITSWLRCLRVHRFQDDAAAGSSWEQILAAQVISDVTPPTRVVQLTMNSQSTKKLSKKAKKRLANSMLQESSIAAHAPGEKNKIIASDNTNKDVVIAALKFAESFIIVCGLFFKPTTYKMLQERLVTECYKCTGYSAERSLWLLKSLEALRKGGPSTSPPPTQYCLHLYTILLNSSQGQISKFCSEALLDIRLHLHCAPPSLNFVLEAQEKQKAPEKRKKISEKNRAALASLLGKKRLSVDGDNTEEVIDISDEPTNKRTRIFTEVDKISVSSDSDDAMIIEDGFTSSNGDDVASTDNVDSGGSIRSSEYSLVEIELDKEIDPESAKDDINTTKDPVVQEIIPVTEKNPHKREIGEDNEIQIAEVSVNFPPIEEISYTKEVGPDNIHDLPTQMPLNISNDTVDVGRSPLSLEVSYDFPSTGKDKVTVLEKIEDENLPSTNDTDDIQITCGQIVKCSQDDEVEKNKENGAIESLEVKVNGTKSREKVLNGDECLKNVFDKTATKDVNVDDMLADFVDEVNEESNVKI